MSKRAAVKPLKLAWYWLLAFKLACEEVFCRGGANRVHVEEHRRLHRELFGGGG